MLDLAVAASVLMVLSSVSFLVGWRVARRCSQRGVFGVSVVVLTALLVFVFRFHGTWYMARLVPFSGAIILANWIPLGGAFLAGVTLGQTSSPRWRRGSLAGLILFISTYSVLCCLQGSLPVEPSGQQTIAVSPQSEPSSCGPCCAALLLRHHGIKATEREMLRLCLTSYRGCPALGLYRGLKLKTADTDWDVQVMSCTVNELIEMPGPLLLRVSIPPTTVVGRNAMSASYRRTYQHAVLLMNVVDERHLRIFDPAIPEGARRDWQIGELREQWLGEAIRLVPRDGSARLLDPSGQMKQTAPNPPTSERPQ